MKWLPVALLWLAALVLTGNQDQVEVVKLPRREAAGLAYPAGQTAADVPEPILANLPYRFERCADGRELRWSEVGWWYAGGDLHRLGDRGLDAVEPQRTVCAGA